MWQIMLLCDKFWQFFSTIICVKPYSTVWVLSTYGWALTCAHHHAQKMYIVIVFCCCCCWIHYIYACLKLSTILVSWSTTNCLHTLCAPHTHTHTHTHTFCCEYTPIRKPMSIVFLVCFFFRPERKEPSTITVCSSSIRHKWGALGNISKFGLHDI
jgi:hypothetical protein